MRRGEPYPFFVPRAGAGLHAGLAFLALLEQGPNRNVVCMNRSFSRTTRLMYISDDCKGKMLLLNEKIFITDHTFDAIRIMAPI